ncbi:hypothetical protein BDN67DRAFT_830698 [Paxillus ammoniavirescens]|nr:hypothetical protein BDN67DRAFT_830698 [Paxillus ammoniavirescens]
MYTAVPKKLLCLGSTNTPSCLMVESAATQGCCLIVLYHHRDPPLRECNSCQHCCLHFGVLNLHFWGCLSSCCLSSIPPRQLGIFRPLHSLLDLVNCAAVPRGDLPWPENMRRCRVNRWSIRTGTHPRIHTLTWTLDGSINRIPFLRPTHSRMLLLDCRRQQNHTKPPHFLIRTIISQPPIRYHQHHTLPVNRRVPRSQATCPGTWMLNASIQISAAHAGPGKRCFGTGSMATTPPEMSRCSQCNWLCLSFIFAVLVTTWSGRGRVSPFLRAWPQKVRARTPSGRQMNAFGQFALKKGTWTIHWVNPYPKVLRWGLEDLSCQLELFSWFHFVLPMDGLQDECLDGLPVGFADDGPNLLTLVGTIIWIVERHFCDDASDWHRICSEMVYTLFWLKEILPMPDLAGTHFGWGTCHDTPVILATALTMTTTTATTIFDDPCGYGHVRQELISRSKNRRSSRVSCNLLDGGHTIGV